MVEPLLLLKSMSTKEDMDFSLDEIEKQLVSSMKSKKLDVSPTYAVANVRGELESSGTDGVNSTPVDITSPMTFVDYGNYHFTDSQVKA